MKNVKLLRLTMENFKACASLTLNFDGRDAVIYGANGAGKTTVYNALTWLLFDKVAGDDGTVMSAPDIKPNGDDGEVADHTAISSVEATFSVDAGTVTLRREYKEVWEAKRSSKEKSMNGHTSNYFWNGVPVQLQDFKARLSATLANEDLFWALSNVHWFGRGMDWKARRNMLADVCGLPDDMAVLAANAERFPGLAEAMNGLPFPDFRKKVDTERSKLEKARSSYPARLDEIRKTIHQYDKTDFAALRVMCSSRETEIQQCTEELAKLDNGTLIASTRNELQGVKNQREQLELENQRYRQSQMPPPDNRRPELEKNLQQWQAAQTDAERRVTAEQGFIEQLDRQLQTLRNNYRAFNPDGLEIQQRVANLEAETFKDAVCPTCGQILPPAAQEKAKQKFDADKERRKGELIRRHNDMCNRADELKANREAAQKRKEEAEQAAENARQNIASTSAELERLPAVPTQMRIVNDLPNYANDMAQFNQQIAALQGKIDGLEQQSAESRAALDKDIARLRWEKSQLDEQIAGEKVLQDYQKREEELLQSMSNAAEELSTLDKWCDMCEAFTRFKVEAIESNVNEYFQTVKFKLFQPQVNGGLKECCDVYVGGGRLDHGLNTGAEYNAGIDVINALSEHYGVRVPLFVDGAESVSELLPIDTQVIRLVVSRDDKELRCELW